MPTNSGESSHNLKVAPFEVGIFEENLKITLDGGIENEAAVKLRRALVTRVATAHSREALKKLAGSLPALTAPHRLPALRIVQPVPKEVVKLEPKEMVLEGGEVIRTYNKEMLTPDLVRQASDEHREVFGNTMHFVVCKNEECEEPARWTASEAIYEEEGDRFVPLEIMDDPRHVFSCPCCHQEMKKVYDPQKTQQIFMERLMGEGTRESFLTLATQNVEGEDRIVGMACAYVTQIGRELWLEWGVDGDPHVAGRDFSKAEEAETMERFLKCVNDEIAPEGHAPIDENTWVVAWNNISVGRSPRMRGGLWPTEGQSSTHSFKLMLELTAELFEGISEFAKSKNADNQRQLASNALVVGDVTPFKEDGSQTPAYRFFQVLSGKEGKTFFNNPNLFLIGTELDRGVNMLNRLAGRS